MKIYTLFYKDTNSYNSSIFVMPNDVMAKKAMRLNLKMKDAERFRNEVIEGNIELRCIAHFQEFIKEPEKDEDESETQVRINPIWWNRETFPEIICNLKDLLNDNNRDMESAEPDNT